MRTRGLAPILVLLAGLSAGCATWQGAQLYQRGTAELEAGRAEAAIRDLEQAARLVPEASEVQNHLGLAYVAEGRLPEARRAFQRALELDCANHAAQVNLGLAEAALASGDTPAPTASPAAPAPH